MISRRRFFTGVNYWPSDKANRWWKEFERSIVKRDFSRLAENRFSLVRIFLLWEDFQPEINRISSKALDSLLCVADLAHEEKLQVLPTFFCGHWNGVNWVPPWMIKSGRSEGFFPLFSLGENRRGSVRNMYIDREVRKAQKNFLHEAINALKGHPAIWGWDLGNHLSHLAIPPSKDSGRGWLEEMVTELKRYDETLPVTLGMHQGDLETDQGLGPIEVAPYCDILAMHADPVGARWAEGALDDRFPSFLALLTAWLGKKEVFMAGFGVATLPPASVLPDEDLEKIESTSLVEDGEAAVYYERVLNRLQENGVRGGLVRSFSDYDSSLWNAPPFDMRISERFYGLFRWNGAPKEALKGFRGIHSHEEVPLPSSPGWIDIRPGEFCEKPRDHFHRLYKRFRDQEGGRAGRKNEGKGRPA